MEEYGLEELAASADAVVAGLGPLAAGLARLAAEAARAVTLDAMEELVIGQGRELLRGLVQLSLDAQAAGEVRLAEVTGADGVRRGRAETFWTEDGVDAPAYLIQLIADRRIIVGATVGMVPVPGAAPPPAVAARMPGIIASSRRLYEAGAPMVAGTDAGISPAKPHDVVRHAPAMLCQLGFSRAEALRAITSSAAGVCGLGHRKGRGRQRARAPGQHEDPHSAISAGFQTSVGAGGARST